MLVMIANRSAGVWEKEPSLCERGRARDKHGAILSFKQHHQGFHNASKSVCESIPPWPTD